jgi:large subunit ribosomal protein L28
MHARCQLLPGRAAAQGIALRSAQPTQRTYATSAPTPAVKNPLQRRRGGDLGSHLPKDIIPRPKQEPLEKKRVILRELLQKRREAKEKKAPYIPPYPYGDHQLFKQANNGLYGEQMIRFGNNVSKDTETKTRRNWKPNVLSKSLYSVALKKRIKLRITAKVLKVMDREGGLDEYLLKDNVARIKELGPLGWELRWTLMQIPEVIDRLRADAAALGLDQTTIDEQWPTPQMMAEQKAAQRALAQEAAGEEEVQSHKIDLELRERRRANSAATEYAKAVKAAQRYLTRGVVDSEEAGLKLAFIRTKPRAEAAAQLKNNFKRKLDEAKISAEDIQEIRIRFNYPNAKDYTVRKIAYMQRKRKQIDEAGGLDVWKASKEGAHAARLEAAGGIEAIRTRKKTEYAELIAKAETAATNENLTNAERMRLVKAIRKADTAIKAKGGAGEDDYVEATLEKYRIARTRYEGGLSEIYEQSREEMDAGGDAWAALVNSTNRPSADQPRA